MLILIRPKKWKNSWSFFRSFPKKLAIIPMMCHKTKDFTDGKLKTRSLQGELRNNVRLSNLWCGQASPARGSMKMWCSANRYAAMNNAKMLQRAPTQSRFGGTGGLRANSNKIRYLPYISNPASVGFNCTLWSSFPCWRADRRSRKKIFGETPDGAFFVD